MVALQHPESWHCCPYVRSSTLARWSTKDGIDTRVLRIFEKHLEADETGVENVPIDSGYALYLMTHEAHIARACCSKDMHTGRRKVGKRRLGAN